MSGFIRFIVIGSATLAILWFIKFIMNPYGLCVDHPNKKLADEYYLCQPFDFTVKKGVWERREDEKAIWEKKNQALFLSEADKRVKIKKKTLSKREAKENWDCRPEFFALTDAQIQDIKVSDYCKYNPYKKNMKSDAPRSYMNNTQEEL